MLAKQQLASVGFEVKLIDQSRGDCPLCPQHYIKLTLSILTYIRQILFGWLLESWYIFERFRYFPEVPCGVELSKVNALWILNATCCNWYWFKWILSGKRNSRRYFSDNLLILGYFRYICPTFFLMCRVASVLTYRPFRNLSYLIGDFTRPHFSDYISNELCK